MKTLILAVCCAMLPAATLSAKADTSRNPRPKVLKIGDTRQYDDGNLKITFLDVAEDQRCPANARCIHAGNAKVILRIQVGNRKPVRRELNTNDKPKTLVIPATNYPPGMVGIMKSYGVSIRSLTPYRWIGKPLRKKDYRLRLAIGIAL